MGVVQRDDGAAIGPPVGDHDRLLGRPFSRPTPTPRSRFFHRDGHPIERDAHAARLPGYLDGLRELGLDLDRAGHVRRAHRVADAFHARTRIGKAAQLSSRLLWATARPCFRYRASDAGALGERCGMRACPGNHPSAGGGAPKSAYAPEMTCAVPATAPNPRRPSRCAVSCLRRSYSGEPPSPRDTCWPGTCGRWSPGRCPETQPGTRSGRRMR